MGMSDLSPFCSSMSRSMLGFAAITSLGLLLLAGCGVRPVTEPAEESEQRYEELRFEVNEQLLQEVVVVRELGVSYRPPAGWQEIVGEQLDLFRVQVYPLLYDEEHFDLLRLHLDPGSGSMYVLTALGEDAEAGAAAARERHEEAGYDLSHTEFRKERFVVRQLLFQAGNTVVFRMFFSAPTLEQDFEASFLIPLGSYEDVARVIESAIGAIEEA